MRFAKESLSVPKRVPKLFEDIPNTPAPDHSHGLWTPGPLSASCLIRKPHDFFGSLGCFLSSGVLRPSSPQAQRLERCKTTPSGSRHPWQAARPRRSCILAANINMFPQQVSYTGVYTYVFIGYIGRKTRPCPGLFNWTCRTS